MPLNPAAPGLARSHPTLLAALACLALCAAPGPGASAASSAKSGAARTYENTSKCPGHPRDADDQIAICTRAIESGALSPEDLASAYYFRGTAWSDKKKLDLAIADYTEAVKTNPELGVAFYNRALARTAQGELDAAIADYTEAINLYPNFGVGFNNRALVFAAQGDAERAVLDFNEAIRIDPNAARGFFGRALSQYNVGRFENAADDLAEALRLGMKSPYVALWHRLAEGRAGREAVATAHLQIATAELDASKWPAPLVDLLMGRSSAEALYKAAESPDAAIQAGRLCEAHFYVAQLALVGNDVAQATPLLLGAERECPHDYTEYQATRAELQRLPH
jgi:lipoprotein NlpI